MRHYLQIKNPGRTIFLFFLYFCIFQVAYLSLKSSFAGLYEEDTTFGDGIYYLVIDIVFLLFAFRGIALHPLNRVLLPVVLFCAFQSLYFYFASMPLQYSLRMLSWGIVLVGLSYYLQDFGGKNTVILIVTIGLIILSAYIISQEASLRQQLDLERGLNEGHWVLLGLPFAFLINKKWIRYVLIALIAATVILSLKSTSILALVLSLSVTFFVSEYVTKAKRSKGVLALVIVLAILMIVWPYVSEQLLSDYGINWEDKISSSTETGGSGRFDIWKSTLDAQFNSTFPQWIIGHGHNAVIRINGFSAHNDFLEILYDYGLIMFVIYVSFCVRLYRTLKTLVRNRSEYAVAFSCSLALFFVLSMFTHLIIYPGLLLHVSLCWTICLAPDKI